MTFREFVEHSLTDFEQTLRREEPGQSNIETRLRGAREFARLLLGEPDKRGETTTHRSQGGETNRRFGGPRN